METPERKERKMHISGWKKITGKLFLAAVCAALLTAGRVPAAESTSAEIEITTMPAAEETAAAEAGVPEDNMTEVEVPETESPDVLGAFAGVGALGQAEPETEPLPAWPRAMQVVENVYLKDAPSEDGSNLDVMLYPDMEVECDGEEGGWILVSYADRTGYVPRSSLLDISAGQTEPIPRGNGYLIAIDPGHQLHQNSEKEPIGPGSSETKMKVSSGTEGDYTGVPEYELTLEVSLKLRDELEARGYEVLMIRTTNDVNISNVERAQMANDAGAAAFLRIHADGADSHSAHGCMTICQTPGNSWNGDIYPECRALSEAVLEGLVAQTGAKNRGVLESNTYTGINWCTVPVTIVEMGFMSNEEEDRLMQTAEYQEKLVQGMANGVDAFLGYPQLITETAAAETSQEETMTVPAEGESAAETPESAAE